MKARISVLVAIVSVALAGQAMATIIVQTSDFISDSNRTHFNGFESIPHIHHDNFDFYTGGGGPYVEDGIQVQQINYDPNWGIMVDYTLWGAEGNYTWYPYDGDYGYTKITMADGSDFVDVGLLRGSGFYLEEEYLFYELYDHGSLVLSGSFFVPWSATYLGFSGGGFDEILLADRLYMYDGASVQDGKHNALAIDSIETQGQESSTIPEPSTIMIWSIFGLGGLMGMRVWRRTKPSGRQPWTPEARNAIYSIIARGNHS